MIVESDKSLDKLDHAPQVADTAKKKLMVEGQDLNLQVGNIKNTITTFGKNEMSLDTQLRDIKRLADDKNHDRAYLLAKFRNLSSDYGSRRMEKEALRKNNTLEDLPKMLPEIQLWKDEFESRALNSNGKTECSISTCGCRVAGDEDTINAFNSKIILTRKTKQHLEAEGEDYNMEYKRTHANAEVNRRKAAIFDRIIGEMKAKAEDFKAELKAYRSKGGNYNPEDYPIETVHEETVEQLDVTGRENKNLAEEIKVLLDKF